MENYIVSARKYRPKNFESVVGQEHITHTLENAIKNNHLAQALLFCGPRGVGKTTCARILAKMINTDDGVAEEDFAFNIFELDAASNNSVDDIRSLIDQVRYAPQIGRYKVYIIDEVHMLSAQAFNAFLKTLEEPPAHAIFILATTEKHKIIPTILSRCQIFDFKRITVEDIAGHLAKVAEAEGLHAEPEALHVIAQKADGALRDALSIFDKLATFEDNGITYKNAITNLDILDYEYYFRATDMVVQGDLSSALLLFNEVLDKGFDGIQFVNGWASHLRDLLVCKDPQTIDLLEVAPSIKSQYLAQTAKCDVAFLIFALKLLNECDVRYKNSSNQRLLVEVTIMQVVELTSKKKVDVAPVQKREAEPTVAKPIQKVSIEQSVKIPSAPIEKITIEKPIPPLPRVEETVASEGYKKSVAQQQPVAPEKPTNEESKPQPANPNLDWLKLVQAKGAQVQVGATKQTEEEKTEVAEPKPQVDLPEEVFSDKEFKDAYNDFLTSIEARKGIHSLLAANRPRVKNLTEMHIALANNTQVSYIDEVKFDMLQHLRTSLKNFKIELLIHIDDSEIEKKAYTPDARYKAMLDINPKLEQFRTKLDLILE